MVKSVEDYLEKVIHAVDNAFDGLSSFIPRPNLAGKVSPVVIYKCMTKINNLIRRGD